MVYAFGMNGGSGVMALFFHAIASAITLICLLAYIDTLPKVLITKNVQKIRMEKMTTEELHIHTYIFIYY